MIVYRTGNKRFIHLLDGKGGLIIEGRWHTQGHEIIYTSASMSLCLLEVFKIQPLTLLPLNTCGIELLVPDNSIEVFDGTNLAKGWNNPARYFTELQQFGDKWLMEKRTLLLKVPSAVVPCEYNYLLNPLHKLINDVKINNIYDLEIENGYLEMNVTKMDKNKI
jgi:RES domain-containing protein